MGAQMAHPVKASAATPDRLSSIPWTHTLEGRTDKLSPDLYIHMATPTPPHTK